MATVTFVRAVECKIFHYGPISPEEALRLAEDTVAAQKYDKSFQADDFQELDNILIPDNLDQRCFGGPMEVDRHSIWIDGGYTPNDLGVIHFEAAQNCVYFAKNTDIDTTVALAIATAVQDRVENSITVDRSVPNRWAIYAPKEIPQHILVQCIAGYAPHTATKKMTVLSDEELTAQAISS